MFRRITWVIRHTQVPPVELTGERDHRKFLKANSDIDTRTRLAAAACCRPAESARHGTNRPRIESSLSRSRPGVRPGTPSAASPCPDFSPRRAVLGSRRQLRRLRWLAIMRIPSRQFCCENLTSERGETDGMFIDVHLMLPRTRMPMIGLDRMPLVPSALSSHFGLPWGDCVGVNLLVLRTASAPVPRWRPSIRLRLSR